MEEKKTKEMFMLEKVEVLYNFEKGMRIADYNENDTIILFIKKNEDKVRGNIMTSVPSSVKISCLSPCQPFSKNEKGIVHMAGRLGTERVVSQRCCGDRGGRAVKQPL